MDRNPNAVIEALRKAAEARPDLHVGKVIANALYKKLGGFSSSLFHLEDDKLAEFILSFIASNTPEKAENTQENA